MILAVLPGERVPLDVRVRRGGTDVDRSIVTGESAPCPAGPGDTLEAGSLNLTGAIEAEVLRPTGESFLAEVTRMLEAAEHGRGRYVRLADRVARLYAPVVHLLAAATFAGWLAATGGDWRTAIFTAVSVLIITCPCALGLAVPVVHVVASGRLFRAGIMVRDGSALERLASVTGAVFDKTGTLTTGMPHVDIGAIAAPDRGAVKALAQRSAHPVARALAAALSEDPEVVEDAREQPGYGVEGSVAGRRARLGRAAWVAEIAPGAPAASGTAFAFAGGAVAVIGLRETLRPLARQTVERLRRAGVAVEVVSGDAAAAVDAAAAQAGIPTWRAGCTPAEKVAHLELLAAGGDRVLMVGDGLNDTPALAAAYVSMAPATASDVGRMAADLVFTRDGLDAVPLAHETALLASRLVRQNLVLAVAYNCIAVPVAVAGLVTPLVAAVAMSASSILVVGNALRLNANRPAFRSFRPTPLQEKPA
jgi:Cu2+-exporting ATPase